MNIIDNWIESNGTKEVENKVLNELVLRLNEDKKKAEQRLDAFKQSNDKEGISFNKAQIVQISTTLFDIKELIYKNK